MTKLRCPWWMIDILGGQMDYFKGKVVWITGASSGIGRYLSLELARRGATCAITSRTRETLEQVVADAASLSGKLIAFPGDVRNLEELKQIESAIRSSFGRIDILIANAGTYIASNPLQFDSTEYMTQMDLNYGGLLKCIEVVLPDMLQRRAGQIVGMASLTGYRGLPRAAAYGASKAAIINFLESARFYLKRAGLSVTIINPGFVRTPLTDKNDFEMPFLTEPEDAARIICDGIARRKREVAFPFFFALFAKFMRVIPAPLYEFIWVRAWARMNYR